MGFSGKDFFKKSKENFLGNFGKTDLQNPWESYINLREKSRGKKIRKSLKAFSTVDFCRRCRKSLSDIRKRLDKRKRANERALAQPRRKPSDRPL